MFLHTSLRNALAPLLAVTMLTGCSQAQSTPAPPLKTMFIDRTDLLRDNPSQMNYGVAVANLDGDEGFEFFVAGFGQPNLLLKWTGKELINIAGSTLADADRKAIGVAACDIDGDGREEIYVLNTDTFGGRKRFGDRIFDWDSTVWRDLFEDEVNRNVNNLTAGRSVACLDRMGTGHYGFLVANYGGPMRLYERNSAGKLGDVAAKAKLGLVTGGRGLISLPLFANSMHMDVFAANENGPNFLFKNNGDGTFTEIAHSSGISDPYENGRGVTVVDANGDELFDIVYGNWNGPHRMFWQDKTGQFRDMAQPQLASPSKVRTVIAADFDNDGFEEIFFNNIGQPNRLFGWRDGQWELVDIGDALEPMGLGTGAAVTDFDGDGQLDLLISHGESGAQPLTLYKVAANDNGWLRVMPLTKSGAPARGSIVRIASHGRVQMRTIDAGSGYLCQMEPVAHFGLGSFNRVDWLEVMWPGGKRLKIDNPSINRMHRIKYPDS